MATFSPLTEDFTGASAGAAVSTANSVFTALTGTGSSTFVTDPTDASRRMMEVATTGDFRINTVDFTNQPVLWYRTDLIMASIDTTTALVAMYDNGSTNKVLDLRQSNGTSPTLQLRNVSTSVWTSAAMALGTKYRVYTYTKVDSTKRIRCMIYTGSDFSTLFDDSGLITSTTVATGVGNLRLGNQSNSTGTTRFGRMRADTSDQPFDAPVGGTNWTQGIEVRIGG